MDSRDKSKNLLLAQQVHHFEGFPSWDNVGSNTFAARRDPVSFLNWTNMQKCNAQWEFGRPTVTPTNFEDETEVKVD